MEMQIRIQKQFVWDFEWGAVSAVANGADDRIATFSSSDALNGEANLYGQII